MELKEDVFDQIKSKHKRNESFTERNVTKLQEWLGLHKKGSSNLLEIQGECEETYDSDLYSEDND